MTALVAVLFLSAPLPAEADGGDPQTFDQVAELFGVADEPADFVVVVDVSGSMDDGVTGATPWDAVAESYAALVDAMRPFDYLGVVAFAKNDALIFGHDLLEPGKRDEALAALDPYPGGDAGSKGGDPSLAGGTDIGAGLAGGVRQLERVGAAEVQTLVLLTDGMMNAPGSPYEQPGSPSWQQLRADADALADDGHRISAYSIGLSAQTDAGLITEVLPAASVLSLPDDQLPGFFANLVDQARREQLRPLVAADLALPVVATLEFDGDLAPEMDGSLVLTSQREKLDTDVEIRDLTVTSATGEPVSVEMLSVGPVRLSPGESVRLPVRVAIDGVEEGLRLGTATQSLQLAPHVDAITEATALDVLDDNDLATAAQASGTVSTGEATSAAAERGMPWAYLAALLAIMALLALLARFLYVRLFQLPELVGVLEDSDGAEIARLSGRLMQIPSSRAPLGETMDDKVEFSTQRRRRKVVFARSSQGSPMLNSFGAWEELGGTRIVLQPGDRLRLGKVVVVFQNTSAGGPT